MTLMAILARYGHVQPDVFEEMDHVEARELATRLVALRKDEDEAYGKLHIELTKALLKAQGARVR